MLGLATNQVEGRRLYHTTTINSAKGALTKGVAVVGVLVMDAQTGSTRSTQAVTPPGLGTVRGEVAPPF